jgi:flagellar basal body-associated protein FliL
MARGTLDEVEQDGDFASGMGIAIGTVIALFAVAIALFLMGQERSHAAPAERETARTKNFTLPSTRSAAAPPAVQQ